MRSDSFANDRYLHALRPAATVLLGALLVACQGHAGANAESIAAAPPPPATQDEAAVPEAVADLPPTPVPESAADGGKASDAKPGGGQVLLGKGMRASIGPSATLRFERVVSDSRCPKDVQCVWAGEVTIELELDSRNGAESFELSASDDTRAVQQYQVQLLSYGPCPGGPATTPLPGECASLQVTPRAD